MDDLDSRASDGWAASLLARTAYGLAAGYKRSDRMGTPGYWPPPADLLGALSPLLRPPDRLRGCCVITGLLDGIDRAAPTPSHWRVAAGGLSDPMDVAMLLIAAVLGRPFGWTNQQDGRLVHNILPSRGYERQQVGASSEVPLMWHTEDAFHPRRTDLLVLACVRNPDDIGTDVAGLRMAGLSPATLAELSRPMVSIKPDDSYPDAASPDDAGGVRAGAGSATPTTWRADDGWCLRYDPAYTTFTDADASFREAYSTLGGALQRCGRTIPLAPGDIAIVDNDVAVHARRSFRARYDGADRWLKRVLVRLPRQRPSAEAAEDGYGQALVEPLALAGTP